MFKKNETAILNFRYFKNVKKYSRKDNYKSKSI